MEDNSHSRFRSLLQWCGQRRYKDTAGPLYYLFWECSFSSSEEETTPDGAVAEYRREKQKYEALRKQQAKKGSSREDQVKSQIKIHM